LRGSMNIRKAQESDIESLLELSRQIGEFHYENAPNVFVQPLPEEREFLLKALNDSSRLFLVATLANKVCGFLTATINKNVLVPFLVKEPICRVGSIVIDKGHRSEGLGKVLMEHCHEWACSSGATEIRLEVMEFNERAQAFYMSLGYKTQSRIMSREFTN